jgi:CHAT domain-containing protein
MFLASLYEYMGDPSSAWRYSTNGLDVFWRGDCPSMRGYSLYAGLDQVAEDTERWFLDVQLIEEALKLIDKDPDHELQAIEVHRLSNALVMIQDYAAAEQSLRQANVLASQSADGTRKVNLEFETEIGLAKVDLQRSAPEETIRRLEPLQKQLNQISDNDLSFDYLRSLGLAYFARGDSERAMRALQPALALAEDSLRRNDVERERLIWNRKTDQAYRAMVQLKLAVTPQDGFAQWEWFKGASLRGGPLRGQDLPASYDFPATKVVPFASLEVPADTAVLSYAVFPAFTEAWIYTRNSLREYRLPLSSQEIELLATSYSNHCSRPDSSPRTIEAESRVIYRKLLYPLESSLDAYTHLLVEPDSNLWLIPFETLIDAKGVYLGDRFAISLSPGLDYLAHSSSWRISKQSRILLAGDPLLIGKTPLEDAEEETKGIARQFRYSKVLLRNDANNERITEELADAEIFHFSGHAAASPDGVGLLLGETTVLGATKVQVSDFSHLRFVVLSACNSANGSTGVFDDRDSLARLFVGAGIPEVVASRWLVNSRATASLMEDFYAQMLSGKNASAALRDASHTLRAKQEFAHPFYWAGFSVFGKS